MKEGLIDKKLCRLCPYADKETGICLPQFMSKTHNLGNCKFNKFVHNIGKVRI